MANNPIGSIRISSSPTQVSLSTRSVVRQSKWETAGKVIGWFFLTLLSCGLSLLFPALAPSNEVTSNRLKEKITEQPTDNKIMEKYARLLSKRQSVSSVQPPSEPSSRSSSRSQSNHNPIASTRSNSLASSELSESSSAVDPDGLEGLEYGRSQREKFRKFNEETKVPFKFTVRDIFGDLERDKNFTTFGLPLYLGLCLQFSLSELKEIKKNNLFSILEILSPDFCKMYNLPAEFQNFTDAQFEKLIQLKEKLEEYSNNYEYFEGNKSRRDGLINDSIFQAYDCNSEAFFIATPRTMVLRCILDEWNKEEFQIKEKEEVFRKAAILVSSEDPGETFYERLKFVINQESDKEQFNKEFERLIIKERRTPDIFIKMFEAANKIRDLISAPLSIALLYVETKLTRDPRPFLACYDEAKTNHNFETITNDFQKWKTTESEKRGLNKYKELIIDEYKKSTNGAYNTDPGLSAFLALLRLTDSQLNKTDFSKDPDCPICFSLTTLRDLKRTCSSEHIESAIFSKLGPEEARHLKLNIAKHWLRFQKIQNLELERKCKLYEKTKEINNYYKENLPSINNLINHPAIQSLSLLFEKDALNPNILAVADAPDHTTYMQTVLLEQQSRYILEKVLGPEWTNDEAALYLSLQNLPLDVIEASKKNDLFALIPQYEQAPNTWWNQEKLWEKVSKLKALLEDLSKKENLPLQEIQSKIEASLGVNDPTLMIAIRMNDYLSYITKMWNQYENNNKKDAIYVSLKLLSYNHPEKLEEIVIDVVNFIEITPDWRQQFEKWEESHTNPDNFIRHMKEQIRGYIAKTARKYGGSFNSTVDAPEIKALTKMPEDFLRKIIVCEDLHIKIETALGKAYDKKLLPLCLRLSNSFSEKEIESFENQSLSDLVPRYGQVPAEWREHAGLWDKVGKLKKQLGPEQIHLALKEFPAEPKANEATGWVVDNLRKQLTTVMLTYGPDD